MKFLYITLVYCLLLSIESKTTYNAPPCSVYTIFTVQLLNVDLGKTLIQMCIVAGDYKNTVFQFYFVIDKDKIINDDIINQYSSNKKAQFTHIQDNEYSMKLDLKYLVLNMLEKDEVNFEFTSNTGKIHQFLLKANVGQETELYSWFKKFSCRSISLKLNNNELSDILNMQNNSKHLAKEKFGQVEGLLKKHIRSNSSQLIRRKFYETLGVNTDIELGPPKHSLTSILGTPRLSITKGKKNDKTTPKHIKIKEGKKNKKSTQKAEMSNNADLTTSGMSERDQQQNKIELLASKIKLKDNIKYKGYCTITDNRSRRWHVFTTEEVKDDLRSKLMNSNYFKSKEISRSPNSTELTRYEPLQINK
jgi:hypothetical protein